MYWQVDNFLSGKCGLEYAYNIEVGKLEKPFFFFGSEHLVETKKLTLVPTVQLQHSNAAHRHPVPGFKGTVHSGAPAS